MLTLIVTRATLLAMTPTLLFLLPVPPENFQITFQNPKSTRIKIATSDSKKAQHKRNHLRAKADKYKAQAKERQQATDHL